MSDLRFTILGSGTSTGIPVIGCDCATCQSEDWRDKRLRTSLLIESETTSVIIDTSTDFRLQCLKFGIKKLDGIVFTHHHIDHIAGFDDIRPFNFATRKPIPIYTIQETLDNLSRMFNYAFVIPDQIGGGIPQILVNIIDDQPFSVGDIAFQPIPMMHGNLRVNGYRIGDVAYCTDTNFIPKTSFELLKNLKILILDALRPIPHPTHFTIDESIVLSQKIGAEITYFTHLAHEAKHSKTESKLPERIKLAFDGLKFSQEIVSY